MKKMTREQQIVVRDHKHKSTEDINRKIEMERAAQRLFEDEAAKAQATLTRARKGAARAKDVADALETLVDTRN
jgi:hypothetical protein